MKKKKLYFLVISLVVVLAFGFWLNYRYFPHTPLLPLETASPRVSSSPAPSPTLSTKPSPAATPIPDSYLIPNLPFQPQAPFANWDALHEEACEEASLILVDHYYSDKALTAQVMEDEIQKMVEWETAHSLPYDVTIEQLSGVAKNYLKRNNFKVIKNLDLDKLKKEIAAGHPVIVPAAGRLLGNPYFQQPGPIYHMVVAVGYGKNTIIVQDVGTKNGNNYVYNDEVFYNAIHDWAGSPDNIQAGSKVGLAFF